MNPAPTKAQEEIVVATTIPDPPARRFRFHCHQSARRGPKETPRRACAPIPRPACKHPLHRS